MTLDWKLLLNQERRRPKSYSGPRTEFERDFDRILFSSGVRRLADKTQVFPLERHDSVRTRLTHSLEVSNLARSIGTALAFKTSIFKGTKDPQRNVPALLAAAGLAHDLGNPPFGHQGERAIQEWFENKKGIFGNKKDLTEAMRQDFLKFDGNAQTLRLVTKLQIISDDLGLNLTYGAMAAIMKYSVPSDKASKKSDDAGRRKPGFFQSENALVAEIQKKTGLVDGVRHPLAYIVEAVDDIAYSVVDAEDAVKKGLVSFPDLMAALESKDKDVVTGRVVRRSLKRHETLREDTGLTPGELNDISMQKFRVYAMEEMIAAATDEFKARHGEILNGTYKGDLIGGSSAETLSGALKAFDFAHAYQHKTVRRTELIGHRVLRTLLDFFWNAIIDREETANPASERRDPFNKYAYSLISDNYRRIYERDKTSFPMRYKELRLLVDMLAGMTDTYAMDTYRELRELNATP
jgi:dGTPase